MALNARGQAIKRILSGVLASLAATALGMALLALAVVWLSLPDKLLMPLNQALKALSIFLGAYAAIGRGGARGFPQGAVVGLLYMALGYGIYCMLDGTLLSAALLALEFLMGAGLGGLSGALIANLKPAKARAKGKKPKLRSKKRPGQTPA